MLVLSRQRDEEILIDFSSMSDAELLALRHEDPIRIQVCDIRGDKVRIGVDASEKVNVNRRELHEKMKRQAAERSKLGLKLEGRLEDLRDSLQGGQAPQ